MDSATGSIPNTSSGPSAESGTSSLWPFPPRSRPIPVCSSAVLPRELLSTFQTLPVNNRLVHSNPFHQDLVNTLNRVQSRKRQREEEEFNRRDVGSQTAFEYGDLEHSPHLFPDQGISLTKRVRREVRLSRIRAHELWNSSLFQHVTLSSEFTDSIVDKLSNSCSALHHFD